MRREVGRHADRDAGAAVDEQVGERGGEHDRLHVLLVIGGNEIDRVLVDVVHQHRAEMRQARLGVPHGRGRVAFDRAEVSLSLDEPLAHRPGLGHVHERGVDGLVAVGMKILHRLADDACALRGRSARHEAQLVHGVENAALGGLQTVAHIGQRARDDDRHRIVEERVADFLRDIDPVDAFTGRKQVFGA